MQGHHTCEQVRHGPTESVARYDYMVALAKVTEQLVQWELLSYPRSKAVGLGTCATCEMTTSQAGPLV